MELADAVIEACKKPTQFKYLYELELSLEEKINIIAQKMYGASKAEIGEHAKEKLQKLTDAVNIFFFYFINKDLLKIILFLGFR